MNILQTLFICFFGGILFIGGTIIGYIHRLEHEKKENETAEFEKELEKIEGRREIKYMLIDFLLAVLFFVIAVLVVSAIIL